MFRCRIPAVLGRRPAQPDKVLVVFDQREQTAARVRFERTPGIDVICVETCHLLNQATPLFRTPGMTMRLLNGPLSCMLFRLVSDLAMTRPARSTRATVRCASTSQYSSED